MSSRTTPAPNRLSGYRLPLLPLLLLLAIVTAQRAGNGGGYREAPAVKIRKQGTVSGVEVPLVKIGARAWTYLGIPYARPPLGDLRFAPPDTDPPPAWHGLRNGSVHMPACVQYPPARQRPVHQLFANVAGGPIRTSEDCLYLNVYRPEGKPSTTGRQKGSFRRGKFIAKIRPLIGANLSGVRPPRTVRHIPKSYVSGSRPYYGTTRRARPWDRTRYVPETGTTARRPITSRRTGNPFGRRWFQLANSPRPYNERSNTSELNGVGAHS